MSETRTRIKICGITNMEDARAAVDYGADALGFILVPESPRHIGGKEQLCTLLSSMPPFVSCVGVCRNPAEIHANYAGCFHAAQFYETKVEQTWQWLSGELKLLYACRMQDQNSLMNIAQALEAMSLLNGESLVSALLLDTYHPDKLGGSGETFNWELAREAKARFGKPILLAGGLTPDNVADAIAAVRPYAVDVSSGVEAEPGRKDHTKLRAFIRAVRRADSALE